MGLLLDSHGASVGLLSSHQIPIERLWDFEVPMAVRGPSVAGPGTPAGLP